MPKDAPHGYRSSIRRTLDRHPRMLGGDTARARDDVAFSLTGQVLNNAGAAVHQLQPQRKPPWHSRSFFSYSTNAGTLTWIAPTV